MASRILGMSGLDYHKSVVVYMISAELIYDSGEIFVCVVRRWTLALELARGQNGRSYNSTKDILPKDQNC